MATVSAHVAAVVAQHIDDVFGVMGNGNAHFIDALCTETEASYTSVRHEAGGVAAADAYFRSSGKVAAATATYGAGFTNTLTPLAEAQQASVPLLLVVGDAPTTGARPWDIDQNLAAVALGVKTFTVGVKGTAARTREAISYAWKFSTPVVLAIPYDLSATEVGVIPDLLGLEPAAADGLTARAVERIQTAAEMLAGARRPVILAGRGAWLAGAGDVLGEVADAVGALTATTALGRSVFPDSDFDLGVTGGFGAEPAMALIAEADVVLVVGASLNQFTMRFGGLFGPDACVIQVDVREAATHMRVSEFIRGDARTAAIELKEALRGALSKNDLPRPRWREQVDVASAKQHDRPAGEYAEDGRLDPRAVALRIGELLPPNRTVVSDGGHFIGWANMYWPVASPDRMVMVGTAYQTIGLGISSIAGAVRAKPDSTVVLTSGDGGGLMGLSDLETAIRTARGNGIAVIWNDAAYAAEVNLYGLKGLALEPMLINETNFALLASAVGAEGVVVNSLSDLERLAAWRDEPASSRRFLLLDCRISPHVIAPYQQEIIHVNS